MKSFIDFTGKKIIIAGASSGIGRKTAELLNDYGAEVILIARREDKLKEVLSGLTGDNNKYYVFDMSETLKIMDLLKKIKNDVGPVDGLVYSCGVAESRTVKMSPPDYTDKVMRVNFLGYFEMVRIICKKGFYNPDMSIVGISSNASINGAKSQSVYSSSKAAMDAATRVMAQEYADKGIRINTVRPGMIKTDIYDAFLHTLGENSNEILLDKQFLGVGETIDIANAIAFLLSPAAKFITGTHFSVDGGNSCH